MNLKTESKSKRLQVLNDRERNKIYGLPKLIRDEYSSTFELDQNFRIYFDGLQTLESQLFFILRLGFFKRTLRFFHFDLSEVTSETQYILEKYFSNYELDNLKSQVNVKTKLEHQKFILQEYSFRKYSSKDKPIVLEKISTSISMDSNPKFIFNECANFFIKNRIILPGYSTMQELISKGLVEEETRVFNVLTQQLSNEMIAQLDMLLVRGDTSRYFLSILKAPIKGFDYKYAVQEREKLESLRDIYLASKSIMTELEMSNSSIQYFAELVSLFQVQRLHQLDEMKTRFLLLCFVNHRYRVSNDNLTKTFVHLIGKYENEVIRVSKEYSVDTRDFNRKIIRKAMLILNEITSEDLHDESPMKELRSRVFKILPRQDIIQAAETFANQSISRKEQKWMLFDKNFGRISRNVRHIFKVLELDSNMSWNTDNNLDSDKLLNRASYLKNHWKNKKEFPISKYPLETNSNDNGKINVKRTEIQLYKDLRKGIQSNDLHLSDSFEYRSLEDDLINKDSFERKKENLKDSISLPSIDGEFSNYLKSKLQSLDESIMRTNQRILSGDNEHFESHSDREGGWILHYESLSDPGINNQIFNKFGKIGLVDLFREIDSKTNFLDCFDHILTTHAKSKVDKDLLIASIIGYATNLGLSKMAECSPYSYSELKLTSEHFLRAQNLIQASETIINETASHETSNYYDLGDALHSSSDGQKFLSAVDTFNAVRSPKYYGLGKGLTVISLNANYLPLGLKIVSSNEYERNYILELLLMNSSNIQPKIHSTDMHGITDINFALLDLCGYNFAPRFTNISSRTANLCSHGDPISFPNDFLLKPKEKIDVDLILSEASNIQRIILSIMNKSGQVSTIVKKLNHSPKTNRTRKALTEYDKLIRSIYIMNYIDDQKLRQNIQTALNRAEGYHQLVKSINISNAGKNIAESLHDQVIFKESNRLVANMIINFNSRILSKFIIEKTKQGDNEELRLMKRISPVAWSAINMHGQYLFNSNHKRLSDQKLKRELNPHYSY